MKKVLAIFVMAMVVTACDSSKSIEVNDTDAVENEASTEVEAKPDINDPSEIIQAFKDNGLPIGEVVVHTSESDPNKLLGRPDGYKAFAHFEDTNVEQDVAPQEGDEVLPKGGSIEVWDTPEQAAERKEYIEQVVKQMNMPALKQYMYLNGSTLLRLEYDIIPEQASKYEEVFMSL